MTPAGYSGTPLPKKLGIKPGFVVAAIDAPAHLVELLGELPEGVTLRTNARGKPDLSLVFLADRRAFTKRQKQLWGLAFPDRSVWVCWPKKSSPLYVDLTEDTFREVLLPGGLVDVKVCAIDDDWSGLKLVVRKELRG